MAVGPQLRALLHAVNALLRKRRYHAALAMLKGFRNGAVGWAGTHGSSLCFFSLQEKLRAILQATYTHSRNLACFVFTYKGLCALQAHVQGETYQVHSFLAAFVGGLLLFGGNNNINSQVKTLPRDRAQGLENLRWRSKKMSSLLPSTSEGLHPGVPTLTVSCVALQKLSVLVSVHTGSLPPVRSHHTFSSQNDVFGRPFLSVHHSF
uniref:Peroxisomal membrane protein 4 n=1 Tax=Ursus americanus TaxID=9643 RepID=A0A452SQ17_URSAM